MSSIHPVVSGWNLAFVPSNKKCSWKKGTYAVTADLPCQSALQLSCEDLQQLNIYAIWMFPSLAPLTRDEPNGLVEAGDQRGVQRILPRNICVIRKHKRCRMSSSNDIELWINTRETDKHTVVEEEGLSSPSAVEMAIIAFILKWGLID